MVNHPPVTHAPSSSAMNRLQAWLAHEQELRAVETSGGRTVAVAEAGCAQARYAYDAQGDLTSITEPHGAVTRFCYDELRRLVQVEHSDGQLTAYHYQNDRLCQIDDRGIVTRYEHNGEQQVTGIRIGAAGARRFRYDDAGRVVEARTATCRTHYRYAADGQVTAIEQEIDGVVVALRYNYSPAGQLASIEILTPVPGRANVDIDPLARKYQAGTATLKLSYAWDDAGRPQSVHCGDALVARWRYEDRSKTTLLEFANGLQERAQADLLDSRPRTRTLQRAQETIYHRDYVYSPAGQVAADGINDYAYDALGRLSATDAGSRWRYDAQDNVTYAADEAGVRHFTYDAQNRLLCIDAAGGTATTFYTDAHGRPTHRVGPDGSWDYAYDDAGCLASVAHNAHRIATLQYDHKGRLVHLRSDHHNERYLYGPTDELLAILDATGTPTAMFVRSPLGLVAVIDAQGAIYFTHHDDRGNCLAISDQAGNVVAHFTYSPFGTPTSDQGRFAPIYGGRLWQPLLRMYDFGARWYDPALARFLTPDPYTAAPDDLRLVHPFASASGQLALRMRAMPAWLTRPRLRNSYAYCGNDPLNRHDANGHWSAGYVILSVLGLIWTLPNTVLGLAFEVFLLACEVLHLLVFIFTLGHVSWELPGFDAAASGHLNTFALVFSGGWFGSIPKLLGMTFGNVFFVYKQWELNDRFFGPGDYYPPAYAGRVAIPRHDALYEHELRHVNQYAWFGPFYHLGLPIFGIYEWDIIVHRGYWNSWLERDARDHSEGDARPNAPALPDAGAVPAVPPAAPAPPPLPDRYGGYDLQRRDRDAGFVYAGAARTAAAGNVVPAPGATGFVRQLQRDLRELGFLVVGADDGGFGRNVEWAVREFQFYAHVDTVAVESTVTTGLYVDRLSGVPTQPTDRYTGPISGVANHDTRQAIARWLANRWRCPVVIGAYTVNAAGARTGVFNKKENIWLHDEVTDKSVRMFVRDFSGYYTRDGAAFPTTQNPNDFIPLGKYFTFLTWSGPVTMPQDNTTWPEAEMLPETLVGTQLANLNAPQRSTYKVVRAVAEVECVGFFDSVNAYDNAFISQGPCHWTLGVANKAGAVDEGELAGYLAYLSDSDRPAFDKAMGAFGAHIDESWQRTVAGAARADGGDLFVPGPRKYTGWVALQRNDNTFARLASSETEGNYFKTWHWFYRFVMAGRTIDAYRRRMWPMARVRLRDIRSAPWPAAAKVPNVPDGHGGNRPATIGDVYTSEKALALLLRWHIRFPDHILSGGVAANHLVAAYNRAAIPAAAGSPDTWTDAHEASLITGILDEAHTVSNAVNQFEDTMTYVRDWPNWAGGANPRNYKLDPAIGPLATTRKSFQFDDADLPPAPY